MPKIEVILDAVKLRNLVSKRSFTNKEGLEVELQEVKFELVEVKEPKVLVSGSWGRRVKTHFAAAIQTKEQRDAKEPTVYVGEGHTVYFNTQTAPVEPQTAPVTPKQQSDNDLPF